MIITEYRIVLPMSVDEYKVGQLYTVAEASKNETGGGEGVEVLVNEPYKDNGEEGQYTHKIYHLESKVPGLIKKIAPKGSLKLHEKAWNAYPYCRTILTNEYMEDSFMIKIETWHKPDMGTTENVHNLDKETCKKRIIVDIDIANNDKKVISPKDYQEKEDPSKFKSVKTGRGPLEADWQTKLAANPDCPHMCAYKLVTVEFKWKLIQGKVEDEIHKFERRLFTKFHRQMFCWLDDWIELSMDDIRKLEEETKKELDEMIKTSETRGSAAE